MHNKENQSKRSIRDGNRPKEKPFAHGGKYSKPTNSRTR